MLAIKALAKSPWAENERRKWPHCWYAPIDDPDEARMALQFALSKPITAAVCPGHAELLWLACDAVEAIGPLPQEREPLTVPDFAGEAIFQSGK